MDGGETRRLVRRIVRHGSRKAADQLVRGHFDALYGFIRRQVPDSDTALNLTQESLIAILKSLPSYDPDRAAFTTWAWRIATYKVIDARRRRRLDEVSIEHPHAWPGLEHKEDHPLELVDDRLPDPVNETLSRDLLARIERRVALEDPAVQEVYRLHLYAGMTFAEIAAGSATPEATVKARYFRLIATIRKEFGDERQA